MGSLLLATGSVQSSATINVGAGDFEDIAVQDAGSQAGSFDNLGTIDVTGIATNYAGLSILPATIGGAGVTASYGDINLTYGFMGALAADSTSGPAGQITLNDGSVAVLAADLQNTDVAFADASDRLDIGQNPDGVLNGTGPSAEYAFGGTISGFRSGDAIGLMENELGATPASLGYNSTTQILSIYSGSNQTGSVLGALKVEVDPGSASDQFILLRSRPARIIPAMRANMKLRWPIYGAGPIPAISTPRRTGSAA